MVFLNRDTAQSFTVGRDLEVFFEPQDTAAEAPTGQFVCVGRCTLSGELLGPPNYHTYQEKLQELHRTRFSHLPIDVYRSKIEIVRDPAMVEQWREQAKTIRLYRDRNEPGSTATLKRSEAEFKLLEKYGKDLFRQGHRFLMPGERAADLPDPELRMVVRDTWTRESRFPATLMFALRPAFKHMRVHLFKAGRETYVTAIEPRPLDAAHVIESISQMLELLRAHPGWTRKDLVEHMKPGLAVDSTEANELLSPLRWLVDKGHVIEFFNGTLALPADGTHVQTQAPAARSQSAETVADMAIEAPASTEPVLDVPVEPTLAGDPGADPVEETSGETAPPAPGTAV